MMCGILFTHFAIDSQSSDREAVMAKHQSPPTQPLIVKVPIAVDTVTRTHSSRHSTTSLAPHTVLDVWQHTERLHEFHDSTQYLYQQNK